MFAGRKVKVNPGTDAYDVNKNLKQNRNQN